MKNVTIRFLGEKKLTQNITKELKEDDTVIIRYDCHNIDIAVENNKHQIFFSAPVECLVKITITGNPGQ